MGPASLQLLRCCCAMVARGRAQGGMNGGARAGCGRKKTKEGPTRKEKSQKRKEKAKLLASLKECCDPVKAAAARKEQRLATVKLLPQEMQPMQRANVESLSKLEAARAVSEKRKRERTLPQYILDEWQRDDKEKAAKAAAAAAPPKPGSITTFYKPVTTGA